MPKIIKGSVYLNALYLKELPDILNGIEIDGDFSLYNNSLRTLKNSPSKVAGNFDITQNQITSFEHAPLLVGNINAALNKISSLQGFPHCDGNIILSNNKITMLQDLPHRCGRLDISSNPISSLQGCPRIIGRRTSSSGASKLGSFDCYNTDIRNMVGGPEHIWGYCDLSYTKLESLEGFPKTIGGNLYLGNTAIGDILWPAKENFETRLKSDELIKQIENICDIGGSIYKDENHYEEAMAELQGPNDHYHDNYDREYYDWDDN